jgi:hypothetical protein
VTVAEYALVLEGCHLNDTEPCGQSPDIEERLDLETLHLAFERRQNMPPKSHVAIAQIGVSPAEGKANRSSERSIAQMAERRQVGAAPALKET